MYIYLLVSLNASWYAFSQLLISRMVISLCIPLFIGMLPLPGSSIFDLGKELETPCKIHQRMKGE